MADYTFDDKAHYAKTHEWVRIEDGIAVVGISDTAQDLLSDVVFVDLPEKGREVTAGEAVAVVESVKAAEDVLAPVSGTVVEINPALLDTPEFVNQKPYEAWFFKLQPTANLDAELGSLLDVTAYTPFANASKH